MCLTSAAPGGSRRAASSATGRRGRTARTRAAGAFGDSRAVVGHHQPRPAVLDPHRRLRGGPRPGVLDGVLHQVAHHGHRHPSDSGVQTGPGASTTSCTLCSAASSASPLPGAGGPPPPGRCAARPRRALGGLELGQEQDVRDQGLQPLGLARGPGGEVPARRVVHRRVRQRLQQRAQAGEGRPELVGHVGDELGGAAPGIDDVGRVDQQQERLAGPSAAYGSTDAR